jgi:hypothetical protein
MEVCNETNRNLLNFFLPHVSFHGKTNITLNDKDYPTQKEIRFFLYKQMDQGYRHSCKQFENSFLNNDVMQNIMGYLYPDNVSSLYVKQYWNNYYLDRLISLKRDVENNSMLYESLFSGGEYFDIRMHCINQQIKKYKEIFR